MTDESGTADYPTAPPTADAPGSVPAGATLAAEVTAPTPVPPPGPAASPWAPPAPDRPTPPQGTPVPGVADPPPPSGPPSGPPGGPPAGGFAPLGAPWAPEPVEARPVRRGGAGRFVLGALIGGLVGALVASAIYLAVGRDENGTTAARTQSTGPNLTLLGKPTDIKGVLAMVEPAVVVVRVDGGVVGGGGDGSGFVVTPDGFILTNNHVIAQMRSSVEVIFNDGTKKPARVVGADPENDLALLKVDGADLPTVKLGDSAAVQVGDSVVAIGNALALEGGPTVTTGIISAVNRTIETDGGSQLTGLLQTDAAISPGNSGGPLVNAAGEVIGINTAVASPRSQDAQNIGFAIAINQAKAEIEMLKQGTTAKIAYLGVSTVAVTPAIQRETGIAVDSGAYVSDVGSDTPAGQAGILVGDVITAIDGKPVRSQQDVASMVRAHQPGDEITVTVNRDGKEQTFDVTLGERPSR